MDTDTYNCTNINTYTDIHPIIVVARVIALTQMAKDCFEDVRRFVVIIVTLCVIVQASIGKDMIDTITIFAFTAATRNGILKGEKRGDVIIIVVHCEQVAGGTGAIVTTSRTGAKAINKIAITGTCTTCGDITTTKSGCKLFSGCDAAGSMGTISNNIYLSRGTSTSSMSR